MIKGEIIQIPFNCRMKNLVGQKFGKLTCLEYMGVSSNRRVVWKCQCECGKIDYFLSNSLLTGRTVSCGCYHKDIISKDLTNQKFGKLIAKYKTNSQDKKT